MFGNLSERLVETFKNLRINLLVVHGQHAPTQFDRNLGEVGSELDLGELAVNDGGELLGRVVDLSGNGIPFAEVRLQADGDNWMRFQRDRDDVLTAQQTDANGYYRFANAASGEWRIAASAKKHENGTSEQVEAAENQRTEVPDLILGPGFELAGVVMDRLGKPIADAEVVARPRNQNNNGRGGRGGRGGPGGQFGGGGNEQSTKTDADGRFFLERLPDSLLDLTAQKKGYHLGGFRIYDIADKAKPRQLVHHRTGGIGVHRFDMDENYAYISTEMEGFTGNILVNYSLANPERPEEVSRWWMPGQHAAGGETKTWAGRQHRLHHALRFDDLLWAGCWHGGVRIIDVADIRKPTTVASYNYHPP
jgi:hypothetical protein